MDYPEVAAAQALRRARVRAQNRALFAISIEIREESHAAIETSKARVARSRIELARLRETFSGLWIRRHVTAGVG